MGTGYLMPCSVPAILAVVSLETGGRTENASQVKKIIFLGCPVTAGIWALGMYSSGYDALVF